MMRKSLVTFLILLTVLGPTVHGEALRFGILPVIDTLPLQVAVQDGFFKEQNLEVELVPFASAMERNTAVHSGQLDGYFGDLIAALLLAEKDLPLRILTISYFTDPDQRMFGLVVSPELKDLSGKSSLTVAISKASIIEYLLTFIKDLPGAKPFDFTPVEITQMPIRLQMLLSGKIDSALLPEPLATLAVSQGARLLATDQTLKLPLTILNISEQKLPTRVAFLTAYGKAVTALNTNPEAYRSLMAETCRIPKPLVASFPVYHYPEPRLPTAEEVQQVQSWMLGTGLLKHPIPYSRLIP